MMKFLMFISFMNFMLCSGNKMMMFYYNLCYLASVMMLFKFMMKDLVWANISMSMGVSSYSLMLVILSIWVVALMMMSLDGWSTMKNLVFINLLVMLMMFFMYMDLFMFYVMFEVSLIPTFFLIIYWGSNPERLSAAFYMMVYMLLISFPLLVYIFDVYLFLGTSKFSLMALMNSYEASFWGFLMLYLPFFIKLPMYMFHIWLPKAHVEAPVYGSMILAGVLLKMGGYGLIRFLEIFYNFSVKFSSLVLSLSIVGSVVVSLLCLVQVDMKSMVAYSSVVHMNLMLGSMMTMSKVGIMGGYVMMVSHGLCSSGLFYMVNLFYKRSGSRLLVLNKGLVSSMPGGMLWWFFFCIMNFSFPLSLNFIGEIAMLMSIMSWNYMLMLNLMMICFFSGAYSLYLFSYIYHGKNHYYENYMCECSVKEYLVLIMHLFPLVGFLLNLEYFI